MDLKLNLKLTTFLLCLWVAEKLCKNKCSGNVLLMMERGSSG